MSSNYFRIALNKNDPIPHNVLLYVLRNTEADNKITQLYVDEIIHHSQDYELHKKYLLLIEKRDPEYLWSIEQHIKDRINMMVDLVSATYGIELVNPDTRGYMDLIRSNPDEQKTNNEILIQNIQKQSVMRNKPYTREILKALQKRRQNWTPGQIRALNKAIYMFCIDDDMFQTC